MNKLTVALVVCVLLVVPACLGQDTGGDKAADSGGKKAEGFYTAGQREGRWTYWYASGLKRSEGDFAAVHSRHEKIHHHQVERLLADQGQCLISILCLGHSVPIYVEQQLG